MEKQIISLNGQSILLVIRRNRAARRVTIRMNAAADGVVMTLPMRGSLPRAMAFLHQKAGWVLSHIVSSSDRVTIAEGAALPLFGKDYVIERMQGRGTAKLADGKLHIYGAPEFTSRRVKDFLKKQLHEYAMPEAKAMAKQLGKTIKSLRIGDMRSRWGSCTAAGALALNWRLIFAPPDILTYLIAHEVAHLAQMDHSPKFWKRVGELYPDYAKARLWLKREGQSLYRFE